MKWKEFSPEAQEAVLRLQAAMEAEHSVIGPGSAHCQRAADYDDIDEEDMVPSQAMLTEWVLVMAYTDPASGETWRIKWQSPNLPNHHCNGLLRTFVD